MTTQPTYTAIFFQNNLHVTWHFDAENIPTFPDGIREGMSAIVKVVGEYEDAEVACLVVEWEGHKFSRSDVYLHITTKALIAPYYSGVRATQNGWEALERPYYLLGHWKYGF